MDDIFLEALLISVYINRRSRSSAIEGLCFSERTGLIVVYFILSYVSANVAGARAGYSGLWLGLAPLEATDKFNK